MYALVRHLGTSQLLLRQMPLLIVSLVIAELFYKLGSFALECLAFLATWAVLDLVAQVLRPLTGSDAPTATATASGSPDPAPAGGRPRAAPVGRDTSGTRVAGHFAGEEVPCRPRS